jgi:hypothetical protein
MGDIIYCPKCEAENASDAVLCGLCGHQLQAVLPSGWGQDAPPSSDTADPPERKPRALFGGPLPMASPETLSNDLVNSIIRKMLQRWNTPLAQMTMWNVLRCQIDLVFFSVLIGAVAAVLFAIAQYTTR